MVGFLEDECQHRKSKRMNRYKREHEPAMLEKKMPKGEYSLNLVELTPFIKSSEHLKAELNILLQLGLNRLDFGMHQWKNVDKKPSFTYPPANPPYPYNDKNLYVNASNNLWHKAMWSFLPELNEIYFNALLQRIKKFEDKKYFFNKGIVYGNLGVSQSAQMKLDEGFANILKALIEDSGYSQTTPELALFRRRLFTQFEDRYVKKKLEGYITQLNVANTSPVDQFVANFLDSLSNDQRAFFDYTFARAMQNWNIWKEKENSFTANRLLACTQDFCLFIEDLLKSKISPATLSTRPFWTLKNLMPTKFSGISLQGCVANSMTDLDQKLPSELGRRIQPNKCLRILFILRNYSSHNVKGGTIANHFYAKHKEIFLELVRAMCYITLLP